MEVDAELVVACLAASIGGAENWISSLFAPALTDYCRLPMSMPVWLLLIVRAPCDSGSVLSVDAVTNGIVMKAREHFVT